MLLPELQASPSTHSGRATCPRSGLSSIPAVALEAAPPPPALLACESPPSLTSQDTDWILSNSNNVPLRCARH